MVTECVVENCTDPVRVKMRGLCKRHYEKWRRRPDSDLNTDNRGRPGVRKVNGPTKVCKGCKQTKDTEEDFYKNSRGWVYTYCKECHNKKTMAVYLRHKLARPPKVKPEPQPCAFPDCRNTGKTGIPNGPVGIYCGSHYNQWLLNGELKPLRVFNKVFKNDDFRQCTLCFNVKSVDNFHVRNSGQRQSVCKTCASTLARMHLLKRQGDFERALEKAQSLPESVRQRYVDQLSDAKKEAGK